MKVISISIKYAENKRLIHIGKANLHKLELWDDFEQQSESERRIY